MNNKTVVAILVLVLVALAGVGVGKYAHNYNMKQEAATLKSQGKVTTPVTPADSKVKPTVPVSAGGPKGTASLAPTVCLNYIQGAAPAPGTLHTGGNVIGTFGLKNICSYDVNIQQIKSVAQGSVDIRLDMDPSNTYAYDSNLSYPMILNVGASTYIGTFIQYAFDASTLAIPAGQTHNFEVRVTVQGAPPVGTPLQTYTTNVQAVDGSGNAVGITGLTGNQQNYSF